MKKSGNTFDKTKRLLHKWQYNFVFSQATKTVTSEFIILHRSNTLGNARLGLALSKKMIPNACDRNKIKRVLRESFRKTSLPAIDIIILAKRGIAKLEKKSISANLGNTWNNLNKLYAK